MRRGLGCAALIVLSLALTAPVGHAGEPVAGVETGVAVPVGRSRKLTVREKSEFEDARIGGVVAPFVGYRFHLLDNLALSLIAQPQVIAFSTRDSQNPSEDLAGIFSLTAGPRFSLLLGKFEGFAGAQAGRYIGFAGAFTGKGFGFSVGGGLNYNLSPQTTIGFFARRDQTGIDGAVGLSSENDNTDSHNPRADLVFVVAGLQFEHRFGALPIVVVPTPGAPSASTPASVASVPTPTVPTATPHPTRTAPRPRPPTRTSKPTRTSTSTSTPTSPPTAVVSSAPSELPATTSPPNPTATPTTSAGTSIVVGVTSPIGTPTVVASPVTWSPDSPRPHGWWWWLWRWLWWLLLIIVGVLAALYLAWRLLRVRVVPGTTPRHPHAEHLHVEADMHLRAHPDRGTQHLKAPDPLIKSKRRDDGPR